MDLEKMDLEKLSTRKLMKLVEDARGAYWENEELILTDSQYDKAVRILEERINFKDSIGIEGTYGQKVHHTTPMLSLDKVYSFKELFRWIQKVSRTPKERFEIQPKLDGLAAIWENNVFSTRGNGKIGQNINSVLPFLNKQPEGDICIGELIVYNSDFRTYKMSNLETPYKTPRNAVSGFIDQKNKVLPTGIQNIIFCNYDALKCVWSFEFHELTGSLFDEILDELLVEYQDYPMDGVVIKLADKEYSESLGCTSHHPRGQMAFKFDNDKATTTIESIDWSFGKWCLTPVLNVKPVEINNVVISKVTGHNLQFLLDNHISVNSEIEIERAGDVIPHFVKTIVEGSPLEIPENCSECGTKLVRKSVELVCPNSDCKGKKLANIMAAINILEIDNLGESTVRKLMDSNPKFQTIADFLELTEEDLRKIEGFQDKSITRILKSIQKSLNTTEPKFLACLNIKGLSEKLLEKLLLKIPFHKLIELDLEAISKISTIEGFSKEREITFVKAIHKNKELLKRLLEILKVERKVATGLPTVCFTGKMPEKRVYYEVMARENNMEPVNTVTKDLNLLVISDENLVSSKRDKAEKLNVEIMLLENFIKEFGDE